MIRPAPDPWHEAVMRLQAESGGLLNLDVVRRIDMARLIGAALAGDDEAADLVRIASNALRAIEDTPVAVSKQCACCARELPTRRFAIVVVRPAVDDSQQIMALAICQRCGTTPGAIKAAATAALKLIWPDVREVQITHSAGGRA